MTSDEPLHKTVCDGRPCRPGEGNLAGYEMWKQPYPPPDEATIQSLSKHVAHSAQGDHYAELAAVASARAKPAHFVALAVADFDYRLLALNWQASADRAGLGGSTVVYALDGPGFLFLRQALGPAMVVNGTANAEAWEGTRLMRHIQRALAEKHMAAGACDKRGGVLFSTGARYKGWKGGVSGRLVVGVNVWGGKGVHSFVHFIHPHDGCALPVAPGPGEAT